MIRIGVVEDDERYLRRLDEYIRRYEQETGENFQVTNFLDGIDIADDYQASFDIIFMDIEMKHLRALSETQ